MPPWPPKPSLNERVIEEGKFYGKPWEVVKNGREKHVYTSLGHINPKGTWLGLYDFGKGKYSLKPCIVRTHLRQRGQEYEPSVTISLSPKLNGKFPLFAVKASLMPGAVDTVLYGVPSEGIANFIINGKLVKDENLGSIRLNNRKYIVYEDEIGAIYKNGKKISSGRHVLVLEYRGRKQILESWRRTDTGDPIWMGDLDGDGKLDLYVGVEGHGGYFERHLFLSSWAEPNEIVGRVGGFADSFLP